MTIDMPANLLKVIFIKMVKGFPPNKSETNSLLCNNFSEPNPSILSYKKSAVCIELSLILVQICDFKFIYKCNFKLDIDDSFHQNI